MKLRVKGDSLRLRITPSEMRSFLDQGRIADTIHFAAGSDARFTYALEHGPAPEIVLRYQHPEAVVVIPTAQAQAWADGGEVGIYAEVPNGNGTLEISVEKDWACLDGSETENADTFPNPQQGATC
jgi:hypothetical protein